MIAVGVIVVLLAAAIGYAATAQTFAPRPPSSPPEVCMDSETRDKLRALMFEGINTAIAHHTEKMFDNLLKDRGHDPARMTRGMHDSLALYARSRENLLKWSPPPC